MNPQSALLINIHHFGPFEYNFHVFLVPVIVIHYLFIPAGYIVLINANKFLDWELPIERLVK